MEVKVRRFSHKHFWGGTTLSTTAVTALESLTESLSPEVVDAAIERALSEDVGPGDVTTDAIVPVDMTCRGKVVCLQDGVVAGLPIMERVFSFVDEKLQFDGKVVDGEKVQEEQIVARMFGPARSMLKAQRVAMNFFQHLSGIASMTAKYVKAVENTGATIITSRKTTPGLRNLELYAARMGGASNIRMGLYDAVVIRDSHLVLSSGVGSPLRTLRKMYPEREITVEVTNMQELEHALTEKATWVILSNFAPGQVRQAMQIIRGQATVEVTGPIPPAGARAYALAGVNFINVGALVHGATALEMTMKLSRY